MSADIFRQIADTGLTFFSLQTGQLTNEHLHQSALNSAGCDTKQFPTILHDARAFIIKYHIACALYKTWRHSCTVTRHSQRQAYISIYTIQSNHNRFQRQSCYDRKTNNAAIYATIMHTELNIRSTNGRNKVHRLRTALHRIQ